MLRQLFLDLAYRLFDLVPADQLRQEAQRPRLPQLDASCLFNGPGYRELKVPSDWLALYAPEWERAFVVRYDGDHQCTLHATAWSGQHLERRLGGELWDAPELLRELRPTTH